MDLSGLLPWQPEHLLRLLQALQTYRSALDASDTGTGKTYVALVVCRVMGIVPLVVGPKGARAGWEAAAKAVGVDIEFSNYERCRPRMGESDWTVEKPWGKGSFIEWKQPYTMIIFDEVHRCGGLTSLNSKLLIAARRQAQYVLALSATAADDPTQMKALGYALGIHGLNTIRCESKLTWMNWQARHGVKPGVFGGWEFTKDKVKQKDAFSKLHSEVFPRHGSRMRKAEIPGFPRTEVLVKLLTDETGKAKRIAEELHELNEVGGNVMAETQSLKMKLEHLMVAHFKEFSEDAAAQGSKVVCFLNYTEPLFELYEKLQDLFGPDKVGYISGRQTGPKGETERRGFVEKFQRNRLDALCVNVFAGGESVNLHDEVDKVERTTFSTPCESGRQYKQELGRVNRANGGFSVQYLCFFAGTYQETVAERMQQKALNVDLFNDRDLLV